MGKDKHLARLEHTHVSLAHGNGGRYMRELIQQLFVHHLGNPLLDTRSDAVSLPWDATPTALMITSDSYTVRPLVFPGGDIGSLAVYGTVNDLAVAGAIPRYMTLNALLEEGLELVLLDRLLISMAAAAQESGIAIVAGDTKVVPRGEGSGVYFSTTGVGIHRPQVHIGMDKIRADDLILLSGPVGDHGTAVMLAREQFGFSGEVCSDCGSVLAIAETLTQFAGLRFMRDPTRGGLATVLHEICLATGLAIQVSEHAISVQEPVRAICDILGYDPLYLACEGRVLAVVAQEDATEALQAMQSLANGRHATIIGALSLGRPRVVLETELGGQRVLEELEDDPLPRIC